MRISTMESQFRLRKGEITASFLQFYNLSFGKKINILKGMIFVFSEQSFQQKKHKITSLYCLKFLLYKIDDRHDPHTTFLKQAICE